MSWTSEMVIIIRHMIDDLADTPKYSDSRLQELILVAAQLSLREVNYLQAYTIDIDNTILTPDPTDSSHLRDDPFINLVTLKAACILLRSEHRTSSGQGIAIKDGSSSIDLRNVAVSKAQSAKFFCDAYEDSKFLYLAGDRDAGQAIVSPFRVGYGIPATYYDMRQRPNFY